MKTIGYFLVVVLAFAALANASPVSNASKNSHSDDNEGVAPGDEATTPSAVASTFLNQETVASAVGAAMGDSDCLKRTACHAGSYVSEFSGKELVIMMLDRYIPDGWQDTLKAFKDSAIYKDDCKKQFKCKAA